MLDILYMNKNVYEPIEDWGRRRRFPTTTDSKSTAKTSYLVNYIFLPTGCVELALILFLGNPYLYQPIIKEGLEE